MERISPEWWDDPPINRVSQRVSLRRAECAVRTRSGESPGVGTKA
ncbi:hypothetical protein ETAR_21260 [Edwardsiella tarda]|nr:hypothetical protein GBS0709_20640 [Edwardsiella tarda]